MMTPDASLMSAPATRGGRISTFLAVGQAGQSGKYSQNIATVVLQSSSL